MMRPATLAAFCVSFLIFGGLAMGGQGITLPAKQVAEEGVALPFEPTINFIGQAITCVDNPGSLRTDCSVDAGPGGGGASPLTTKGDLYTYSTVDTRLPVGADTLCLKADSSQSTGLVWGTCAAGGSGLTFGEVQRLVFLAQ